MATETRQRFAARFALRDLLVLVGILSVSLGIAAHYQRYPEIFPEPIRERVPQGAVEGLLTGVALLLFYLVRLPLPHYRVLARVCFILTGLICLWFSAVDRAHHLAFCPRCDKYTASVSYRVYRIPICAWHYEEPNHLPSEIAADLGVPCPHPYETQLWVRFWGLAYVYPGMAGTIRLHGGKPETYEEIRPYVRAMLAENPDLPAEYHRRAIEQSDLRYVSGFLKEIRRRREEATGEPWQ
jgi:hypothetical protein